MTMSNNVGQFGDTTLTKVFVGGLAWETPREAMERHFEKYGEILEAVIISDKLTGRSKGYGFVTFKDAEAAKKACEDPNPIINDRRANCNLASLGARRPRSASTAPPPPPPQQGSNVGPRATSAAHANHVPWYYPAVGTPASHFHHQAVPFYGYSPTYIPTDMSYNHKLSYNGGSYMNGHFSQVYPAGQAIVGANTLMPMYHPFYHYHQSQTMGLPASATHIFPSTTAGPIATIPTAAAAAAIAPNSAAIVAGVLRSILWKMGKLGKKARKFAKKNLQSVLKRKRQLKSMFKKKASKRDKQEEAESVEEDQIGKSNERDFELKSIEDVELDAVFCDESDVPEDDSGSDGYLSEDSSCPYLDENGTGSDGDDMDVDNSGASDLLEQNRVIHLELSKKKKKLERLQKKDPKFSKYLESYENGLGKLRDEDSYSDDDGASEDGTGSPEKDTVNLRKDKLLTSSALNSLCQLVREHHSISALTSLLNGYRAACHYGTEPSDLHDVDSGQLESKTFSKILIFMLQEADNIFREMLGIPCSSCKKEAILELKNSSKWKTAKPLIKSYLRSTLFLLNQVTDSEILAFSLVQIRASVIFFAAFRPLLHRLIKIAVHLWVTGEGALASHSFLVIKDVASVFSSDCFNSCLIKTYKAFIGQCKFVDPVSSKHIQFLRNSFVELCSQDLQNSSRKAMVCVEQLSKILQTGLQTKNKEAVKRICSWQYTNCIDLWVSFISANIRDYDLQPLLYIIIQIINGVAVLFPGPKHLPLRIKCIQWLNSLSSASGVFIPVASYAMDILEYKTGKDNGKPGKDFNFSSTIKLPKHWLKSRNFQEKCVSSVIELLATHFAQWSYHITFPELATIPLICLKKFLETTTIESFRRVVKRFIDQVEQNIEFIQRKRDEVAFSPKDHQSVESFLQFEKSNANAPFTQYYKSIIEKAASSKPVTNQKLSSLSQKKAKRKERQPPNNTIIHVNAIDEALEVKKVELSTNNGKVGKTRKKRKA
ncbi:hypothetical protein V6N11_000483 [Hibiscus sabdariffa]|uniref:RRM domain-containing protein n=1 Tax=Hibiscus sabdariffa TaxID=183260 RepID=A0ABR2NTN3_9ROSI